MDPLAQLRLPLPQPGAERGDLLADRLCALIARRGRPLEVGHVASQLLRLRRCPERLQRRLVAELVEGDARLAWLDRDLVGLAPPGWQRVGLGETDFCVVDLETTGGSPGAAKVTEIGAVRVRGLALVERFVTLVDPGRPIPPTIRAITGIDDAMVAGQPPIETALADFVAFAGTDVLVAHNAPFDLRFLNYERRRTGGRYFTQPWLDTLTLARRLLRGRTERHDLHTLAAWADTRVRPCHRALPDAEATAELLVALIGLLAERGVETLEGAVAFGGTRVARHAHKLALAEELPQAPGVYLMRDRHDRVLYVGKAANLRRRVRSYFGPAGRHSVRIGRALEDLERIEHERCGSELEAVLRERRLLRELRPPCNSVGIRRGLRFLKLTSGEPFPRLYSVAAPADDGARYFGPLRSDRTVRAALDALHELYPLRRCHPACRGVGEGTATLYPAPGCGGPCAGGAPAAYAAAVAQVAALLAGDPRAADALPARAAHAAAEGRWSGDDGCRERLEALLAVLAALGRVRWARAAPAVLVETACDPTAAVAFFVAGGRVRARAELTRRAWRAGARRGLAALRAQETADAGPTPDESLDTLDEALLVAERLRQLRGDPRAVRLEPGWHEADALAAVGRAVRAVVPGPAPVAEARPAASARPVAVLTA